MMTQVATKQVWAALWMAAFACLAAPFWLEEPWMVLPPAVAGGISGWWLQAGAVGGKATFWAATAIGVCSAFLSLPLFALGFVLVMDGPATVLTNPGKLFGGAFFVIFLALWLLWWWIAAWGAVAGLTLHLACRVVERASDRCPLCRLAAA